MKWDIYCNPPTFYWIADNKSMTAVYEVIVKGETMRLEISLEHIKKCFHDPVKRQEIENYIEYSLLSSNLREPVAHNYFWHMR